MGFFAVATLLLPVVAAVPLALDAPSAAKTLDLVTFEEGDKTNFKWTDLNDPVMGGRSTSTFKVEGGKGVFDGVCRIVPQLKAPGFCNAEARPSFGQKVPDASAFIEGGLERHGGVVVGELPQMAHYPCDASRHVRDPNTRRDESGG